MQSLKNKVALVTGSTGEGIGRSIAFTLAREGAKVVLNYGTGNPNNSLAGEKVLDAVRSLGGKGYAFKADTREEDEVKSMVNGVLTLYGQLDLLICNSGGAWDADDITEVDQSMWRSVIKAEIDGLFFCVKHTLPYMREAHFGRIVAIGLAGAEGRTGPPHDYIIGKAARNTFIRSLAADEYANGITCNVVAPGHIPHVTMRQAVDATKHQSVWKKRTQPLPQDVAETVAFLCSEEGSFVTGSIVELNGSGAGSSNL